MVWLQIYNSPFPFYAVFSMSLLLNVALQQYKETRIKYNWISVCADGNPNMHHIRNSLWQTVARNQSVSFLPAECGVKLRGENQTTNICPPVQLPHISSKCPRMIQSELFGLRFVIQLQMSKTKNHMPRTTSTSWEKCTCFSSALLAQTCHLIDAVFHLSVSSTQVIQYKNSAQQHELLEVISAVSKRNPLQKCQFSPQDRIPFMECC